MKLSRPFIVGIMAGSLLFGGCGAEKEDSQVAENAEIREVDEAETREKLESIDEVEAGENSKSVDETVPEEEQGSSADIELIYGEMTEDFYMAIEDTTVLSDSDDVVVTGILYNSPLYVNTEVDILSDGQRLETSIGGIELYDDGEKQKVDCVEPNGQYYFSVGTVVNIILTGIREEDVHAGDIIVLRGCENPFEEIFAIVEELTTADIPEDKAYIPAYAELIKQLKVESNTIRCKLIYLNDDQIPELVARRERGADLSFSWLYAFASGEVHTVSAGLGCGGAGGLGADEYLPRKNVVRFCCPSNAGLELTTNYYRMNESYELEDLYNITYEHVQVSDSNNNEGEEWQLHFYYEDQEISEEEYNSYEISGEYEAMVGDNSEMTASELLEEMREMLYAE